MTHMVNAMDRSYADQSTLHGEDPMAVTFMDSHNYNNRCRFILILSSGSSGSMSIIINLEL